MQSELQLQLIDPTNSIIIMYVHLEEIGVLKHYGENREFVRAHDMRGMKVYAHARERELCDRTCV